MISWLASLMVTGQVPQARNPVTWNGQTLYSNASALIVTMGTGSSEIAIPCTKDEGDRLRRVLTSRYQYLPANVMHLDSQQATIQNVRDWFQSTSATCKQGDSILVVISLHGARDQEGGFFKLSGKTPYDRLDMSTLATWVKDLPAKHVAVVVDTCYAGQMFAEMKAVLAKGIRDDLKYINMTDADCGVIVAASDADQTAGAEPGVGSRFGQPFLEALEAPAEFPVQLSNVVSSVSLRLQATKQRVDLASFKFGAGSAGQFLFVPGSQSNGGRQDTFEAARQILTKAELEFDRSGSSLKAIEAVEAAYALDQSWRVAEQCVALAVAARGIPKAEEIMMDQYSRGTKIRAVYVFLALVRFLDGDIGAAHRFTDECVTTLGASVETIALKTGLGMFDSKYGVTTPELLEQLKLDPTNHFLRHIVVFKELSNGRRSAAMDQLDNLAYYGGFDWDTAADLTMDFHSRGQAGVLNKVIGEANFDGTRGISTQLLLALNLLVSGELDQLGAITPSRPASRRQRAGLSYIQALGAYLEQDYAKAKKLKASTLAILAESPTSADSNSKYTEDFPEEVFEAVGFLDCLDPAHYNALPGDEAVDRYFENDDQFLNELDLEDTFFFVTHGGLADMLRSMVSSLHMKSIAMSKHARRLLDQPIYRMNEDGEEYEAKYMSVLELLSESNVDDTLFQEGLEVQKGLIDRLLARFRQGVYVAPTCQAEAEFESRLAGYASRLLATPKTCAKVDPAERKFLVQVIEASSLSRVDDFFGPLALANMHEAMGNSSKAASIMAQAKKRWPWLKR